MNRIFGYLRPSITEKDPERQRDRLHAAGVSEIYQEEPLQTMRKTPQLNKLIAEIRNGDMVVVTSLDRIAHNTKQLLEIMEVIDAAGATFRAIDNGFDTSTSQGEAMRALLGVIIDFERKIMKENQTAGILRAKRAGRYKGRKPTARAKTVDVLALNEQGLTRQKIADELEIGVASVYRILKENTPSKMTSRKINKKKPVQKPAKQKKINPKTTQTTDVKQLSLF